MNWCATAVLGLAIVAAEANGIAVPPLQDPRSESLVKDAKVLEGKPFAYLQYDPGYVADPKFDEFEVAIWPDGRIIWRDCPIEYIKVGNTWELNHGRYFEGKCDPKALRLAIREVDLQKVYEKKWWGLLAVDASSFNIRLIDGKHATEVASNEVEADATSDESVKMFVKIRRVLRSLIPISGKKIDQPDFKTQLAWMVDR